MNIVSWNLNGLSPDNQNHFTDWLIRSQPDICCLQEVSGNLTRLKSALHQPPGYQVFRSPPDEKGISNTAIFTRLSPLTFQFGAGSRRFDEGRILLADFETEDSLAFSLVNIAVPSGRGHRSHWFYKMAFLYHLLEYLESLSDKNLILCGSFYIAHQDIDIARALSVAAAGFLPEERQWIDELLNQGFVDSFRALNVDRKDSFTTWSQRAGLRERNIGWRADYIFAAEKLWTRILNASIHPDIVYSLHCPIGLKLE